MRPPLMVAVVPNSKADAMAQIPAQRVLLQSKRVA